MSEEKNNSITDQDTSVTKQEQPLIEREKRIIESLMENITVDDTISVTGYAGNWRVISIDGLENPIYTCAQKGKDEILNIKTTGDKIKLVKKHKLDEKVKRIIADENMVDDPFAEFEEESEDNMSDEEKAEAEEDFDEIETQGHEGEIDI